MTQSISQWMKTVHDVAVSKGWYDYVDDPISQIVPKLLLIHSEVTEAAEEFRAPWFSLHRIYYRDSEGVIQDWSNVSGEDAFPKPEGFAIELADVVIRIFDLAELLGLDLEKAIEIKNAYNMTRTRKHGNKAF